MIISITTEKCFNVTLCGQLVKTSQCVCVYIAIYSDLVTPQLKCVHPGCHQCVSTASSVLLAGDRERRHWEPLLFAIAWTSSGYSATKTHVCFCWIPSHCGIEGNESQPASTRDLWPQHRPISKCPPCRCEAISQLLYPAAGSNQVGCGCTW